MTPIVVEVYHISGCSSSTFCTFFFAHIYFSDTVYSREVVFLKYFMANR